MDPMLDEFARVVGGADVPPAPVPMVSTVTGAAGRSRPADLTTPRYWVRHVRETVRFADAVAAAARGGDPVRRVGPDAVLDRPDSASPGADPGHRPDSAGTTAASRWPPRPGRADREVVCDAG